MSKIFIDKKIPCPKCKTSDYLVVRGYDEREKDGDVYCSKCNQYVRYYYKR